MRLFYFLSTLVISMHLLFAQEAALVSDPGQDQFDHCKQLYRHANSLQDFNSRREAYWRVIPRLKSYVDRFPKHENTAAASYYLGECYYHSGSINDAKRVLSGVVKKYGKGRYVALSSNRLGYDAVAQKKYGTAAVHFGKVAEFSDTDEERFRGRYQQASCYRLAGDTHASIRAFSKIVDAEGVAKNYKQSARLILGHLYLKKGDKVNALEHFEKLMLPGVSEKMRIEATLNVGFIVLDQGDAEKSSRCFKTVLASKQDQFKPNAQAALMQSLYKKKDYQGVLHIIKQGDYPAEKELELVKYSMAGRSAYQLKRYHDAIRYFARAESQKPLSPEAFEAAYYRLLCFYNIEGTNIPVQVDGFLEVYKSGNSDHERIHKAFLMKAETLFDQEKFREASVAYNQINSNLVGKENHANLLYKRGWCLSESGDHNGAVRGYTRFLNTYADDIRSPSVIARRGASYLALGDRASALKDFDLLINKYPEDKLAALAFQNSAKIKKEDEDYAGMVKRYETLVERFPAMKKSTIANAHYWIGWGKYQLKQYEAAMPALRKSVELEEAKYSFNAGMLIVFCAHSLKEKEALKAAIDRITDLGKGEKIPASIYCWLGLQCYNADEVKDSERYLTLGTTPIEPRQTSKAYWKMLGDTRVEIGKYEEALEPIKNFLDVVEQPFWKAEALYNRSVAYLGLRRLADAKASAEEALALRPKGKLNAELKMVLGDIAYTNKEYSAAASFYVVVVQFFVDDQDLRPKALYKSYLALKKKGDAKEAGHYMEILQSEFPDYLKDK